MEFKTLADLKALPGGAFKSATASVDGAALIAMFASNSGAMIAGHVGTIVGIDYEVITGRNITKLENDQTIVIGDVTYVLATKGEMPVAPTVRFDTGRTMTLGLLTQGQEDTTVKLIGKDAKPFFKFSKDELFDLVGRKLECIDFNRNPDRPITRNAGTPNASSYAANYYKFVEVA